MACVVVPTTRRLPPPFNGELTPEKLAVSPVFDPPQPVMPPTSNVAPGLAVPMPTLPELVSTTKSSVLTTKSPVVARLTRRLEPLAGASVSAPLLVEIV
jgi:hypothetical protein